MRTLTPCNLTLQWRAVKGRGRDGCGVFPRRVADGLACRRELEARHSEGSRMGARGSAAELLP